MPKVKFTTHLVRYFPTLENPTTVAGETVADVVANLNKTYPGLADYIVDERGVLRKHVNIFIRGDLIHDRKSNNCKRYKILLAQTMKYLFFKLYQVDKLNLLQTFASFILLKRRFDHG